MVASTGTGRGLACGQSGGVHRSREEPGPRRSEVTEQVTTGLVRRGLLIEDSPGHGVRQPGDAYSLKPELGLTLAARCRPAFVVVAKGDRRDLRPRCLFALGDQEDPVQAIVAELPAGLPPDRAMQRPCGTWYPPTARTTSTRSASNSVFKRTEPWQSSAGSARAAPSRLNMTLTGSAESCSTCSPRRHDE